MSRIAVVHLDLTSKGGGEAVCMNAMEALQQDHEVHLYTAYEADIPELNQFYNTNVEHVEQHVMKRQALLPESDTLALLAYSTFRAFVVRAMDDPDLVINTEVELCFPHDTVHYVHYPRFFEPSDGKGTRFTSAAEKLFRFLCRRLARFSTTHLSQDMILTNSDWTARRIHEAYGIEARVLHPPVDMDGFDPRPWSERELGFVSIGRIVPQKNVLRNIEILAAVRDRGHDVHYHILGPPTNSNYFDRVRDRCAESEFIHYEGAVPRKELISLVCRHRYGIHGRSEEHFGIAVAELVAGGTLPFVPNCGGQTEIVNDQAPLTYESTTDAVDKIDEVLSTPEKQRELRDVLESRPNRYSPEQYKEGIRNLVEENL